MTAMQMSYMRPAMQKGSSLNPKHCQTFQILFTPDVNTPHCIR